MLQKSEVVPEDQVDEISWQEVKNTVRILKSLLHTRFFFLLCSLTRHYPLSKYFWNYNFHYRFREENIIETLLYEKSYFNYLKSTILSLDSDQYFVHLTISITTNPYSHSGFLIRAIRKTVGKENVYIYKLKRKHYKLDFIKSALDEKMLLHRKFIPF